MKIFNSEIKREKNGHSATNGGLKDFKFVVREQD